MESPGTHGRRHNPSAGCKFPARDLARPEHDVPRSDAPHGPVPDGQAGGERGTYWHGGVPELTPGQYLLPSSHTHTPHVLSAYRDASGVLEGLWVRPWWRRHRVYVAPERAVAEVFAAMYPGGGWVYRVEPEGVLETDRDCPPGESWACERARILEAFPLSPEDVVTILEAVQRGGVE